MNSRKGLFLALLAWTSFAISDVFLKILSESGLAPLEIVSLFLVGNAFVFFLLMRKANWLELKEFIFKRPVIAFILGSLSITTSILCCSAFALLPIPEIYVFVFMTPVVTFFTAKLILKENIPWQRWLVVFTAFLGVVFAYYGDMNFSNNELSTLGIIYCAGVVISLALNVTLMRYVRLSPQTMGLWASFFGIILLPFILKSSFAEVAVRVSHEWIYAIALIAFSSVGILCRNEACRITHASVVAVTHYFQMPIGILTGFLVWSHLPSLSMIIGATIIIISGIILIRNNREKKAEAAVFTSNNREQSEAV